MSSLYTYGTGSIYKAERWSDLQDLLNQLQDNNANLIFAEHVRDAVFTLWERVNEVAITAASASALSPYFQNSNPTTVQVGGIALGTTFSTQQTVQQMFDLMLYPYVEPTLNLTGFHLHPLTNKEYGQNPNSTVYWYVTKGSNTIQTIEVDDHVITPNGGDQSGTKVVIGSYTTIEASTTSSFEMTVNDGFTNYTVSTEYEWMNKLYWGTIDLSGIEYPDFTLDPGLLTTVTMNSSTILGLDNSVLFKGGGNDLVVTTTETFDMPGTGGYLVYAWSSYIPYSTDPKFKVNGAHSTAFSNIKTGWNFTNHWGVTSSYEVWISNTAQNSQLDVEIKFGPSTI